jgi:photosystem II stability/assembly factor-like uncharacterized protein
MNRLIIKLNSLRHFIIITAICLCFAGAANAQQRFQWQSTGGPATTAPSILEVNSNGDIIAGYGNILMRSTDGGVSWSRLPIPRYLGNINSSVTLPGGKIIMLCSQPAIVRMNADGSSLTTLPLTNATRLISDRMGDLFAFLNSTMIAKSKDAGDTWDTIVGPTGETIDDFSADEQDYYISTQTGIYYSSDEGTDWRRCLNGIVDGNYYSILAGHNGHVWVIGYIGNELIGQDYLYLSTDYGQHWMDRGYGDIHYAMVANSKNDVLTNKGSDLIINDSEFQNAQLANGSGLFAVDSSGRWLGVASGLPNLYQASVDLPLKWQPLIIPISSPSLIFRAYSTVFTGSGTASYIMNFPIGWKALSGNNQIPLGMDFFDTSMLGTSTGNDLVRSTDSGKTWSANLLGSLPPGTVSIAAAAPSRIYAATKGVYYTDDIGKDWSETNDNFLTGSVTCLCADSTGSLFVACSDGLFTSTDQGNSWRPLILPPNGGIRNMRANPSSTIAFYSSDTLFRSESSGLHWQWASLPDHSAITDFYISPTSDVFASSNSGVYYWPAGGTNFVSASDGLDSIGVNALAADSAGNIYAATNGMGVWVGVGDPSLLGVAEHSSIVSNVAISPNPASSIVNIGLPYSGIWNAVAMDCLGRELPMKYSLAGETIQCDVSNFTPGAYEIILRSGANQIVSRVQVIR